VPYPIEQPSEDALHALSIAADIATRATDFASDCDSFRAGLGVEESERGVRKSSSGRVHDLEDSMQEEQQRPPPPAYAQHEPESFHLPSVPTHLPHTTQSNGRLPGIRSLDLPDAMAARHSPHNSVEISPRPQFDGAQWGHLPLLHSATFPRVPEGLPRMPEDMGSPMDTASVWSAQDEKARREMSVSIEDPDVRQAAEALSGLGNPGMS
jgi:hypothetical protein